MKLLVTGFGAFPDVPINTSEQLVAAWMRKGPASPFDDTRFEVLPTAYDMAGTRIERLLREYQPDRALLLGVATTQSTIRLERFALNINDSPVHDEAGSVRRDGIIAPDGPHALKTTIDLVGLQAALVRKGVDVEISNHAGAYVCNHTYYSALRAAALMENRCAVLFVHVPGIHKLSTDEERDATLQRIGLAVSAVARSIAAR